MGCLNRMAQVLDQRQLGTKICDRQGQEHRAEESRRLPTPKSICSCNVCNVRAISNCRRNIYYRLKFTDKSLKSTITANLPEFYDFFIARHNLVFFVESYKSIIVGFMMERTQRNSISCLVC